jgi:hypothetical protein
MDEFGPQEVANEMGQPQYEHDCDACKFLGKYGKYDMWYCGGKDARFTSPVPILRYGSDGPDYASYDLSTFVRSYVDGFYHDREHNSDAQIALLKAVIEVDPEKVRKYVDKYLKEAEREYENMAAFGGEKAINVYGKKLQGKQERVKELGLEIPEEGTFIAYEDEPAVKRLIEEYPEERDKILNIAGVMVGVGGWDQSNQDEMYSMLKSEADLDAPEQATEMPEDEDDIGNLQSRLDPGMNEA